MNENWDVLEALAWATYMAWNATLVGNPAPVVKSQFRWMKSLVVGALVMERSTLRRRTDHTDAIGIVEKIEDRLVCKHEHADPNLERCDQCTDEEDIERDCPGRWREYYVWLRTRAGRHRWYNADFIRIPRNARECKEAEQFTWA